MINREENIEYSWTTKSNHRAMIIKDKQNGEEFRRAYIIVEDPLDPIFKLKNNLQALEILTDKIGTTFNPITSIVFEEDSYRVGFATNYDYPEAILKDSKELEWVVKECELISVNISYNYNKHSISMPSVSFSAEKIILDASNAHARSAATIRNKISFKFDLTDSKKPYDIANEISRHLIYFQSGTREILNSTMNHGFLNLTPSCMEGNLKQKYKFVIKVFLKDNTLANLMVSPFAIDTPIVAKDSKKEYIDLGSSMCNTVVKDNESIELKIDSDTITTPFNNTTYRTNMKEKEVLAIYIAYRGIVIHKGELVDRDTCVRLFLDKRNCKEEDMSNLNDFLYSMENNKDYLL